MAESNGGVAAPAPTVGLASARRPRSVNRRQTPRGKKIQRSVSEQQQARAVRGNGGTSVDPGYGHAPQAPHPAAAISNAVQPDLGAQLSRRVSSGAIDQGQATQVAHDRALLEQVYGPSWRDKVFGGAGRVRRLRQDVTSDEPGDSKKTLEGLLAQRKSFLAKARTKVAGG